MNATLLAALLSLPALAAEPPKPPPPPTAEAGEHPDDAAQLARLSPEQLVQVLQDREKTRLAEAHVREAMMGRHGRPEDVLVPGFLFLFLAVVVLARLWAGMRWDRMRHETIRAMVEKGAAVPRQLLELPPRAAADLRRGVVLIALGVGGTLCLALIPHEPGVWALGSIPTLVGIGYLITWRMTKALAPAPAGEKAS